MKITLIPNSIVARVTLLTIVWMFFLIGLFLSSLQTPLVNHIHKRVLANHANSLLELAWLLETSPTEMQSFILSAFNGGNRSAILLDTISSASTEKENLLSVLQRQDAQLAQTLIQKKARFRVLNALQLRAKSNIYPFENAGAPIIKTMSALEVAISLENEQILLVRLAPALVFESSPFGMIVISVLIVLSAPVLALALRLLLMAPIRQLQRKSEQMRLSDRESFLSDKGPIELRSLTLSVNGIRERLNKLIREREMMVSAIAHDVRTGLTRLRLRFDESNSLSYSTVKDDMRHLETLTADMLAYARAENISHHQQLVRLNEFVADLVHSLPFDVEFNEQVLKKPFDIVGDTVAIRRMFDNLVENARRYGNGKIEFRSRMLEHAYRVDIIDDGPGIPEHNLEQMFEPFQRMESSRNRETGGSGLGLGIARAIARAHGAQLQLENHLEGGLCASVSFPINIST